MIKVDIEKERPFLDIKDLTVSFDELEVIHKLDLEVFKGEILAVIGSSGSGKSLLAHSILGILPKSATLSGKMTYDNQELTDKRKKEIRGRDMVLIPQSIDFLDPLMKVGKQVKGTRVSQSAMEEALRRYGLSESLAKVYPFQLSGGMARRILITTAVTESPRLIIADEPTPGLDLEMARESLKHLREFADAGCAVLLITHDIDIALDIADKVAVMYAGTTVEIMPAEDFKKGKSMLRHPYSKAFYDALPQNAFVAIPGRQPYAGKLPKGCLFSDRCPLRTDKCSKDIAMRMVRGGEVRCIHAT